MPLLTSLLLVIVLARLLGQLMVRMKQPALVGEMLAGVILGPAVLNLVHAGPALAAISELAVFLVVLSAGLEMNFKDVVSLFREWRGLVVASLGFFLPFAAGMGVGIVFDLDVMRTVFLGLCVSITALPVAIRILESFNLLKSTIANYSVATAILNDIAALLVLGVLLDLPSVRSFQAISISIIGTGGKLVLLAAMVIGFNMLLQRAEAKGVRIQLISEKLIRIFGNEALLGIVIAFVLVFGSVSDALGFHSVIGVFFGALLIDKKFFLASRYHELERTLGSVTNGFLAPVFFAYLGLEFKLSAMQSVGFVVSVLAVSILSKVAAGWVGGLIARMPNHEALGLGVILNGRGVMELVVAGIAYQRGFIGSGLFSTLVLMGVVTTLITPILFRKFVLGKLDSAQFSTRS